MHLAPIAVIGNANLDLVAGPINYWPEQGTETFLEHSDSRIGGSAANTALVLQRLRAPSGLIASAGSDIIGDMICNQFSGVLDRIARVDGPSSVTFGLLHPGSERTFFSTPGHLDRFDEEQVLTDLSNWPLQGALALVAGSFALPDLQNQTSSLLTQLGERGAWTAIDPGWPGPGWIDETRDLVLNWIDRADVILINDKEIIGLTGRETVQDAITDLQPRLRPGAELVVKCGPEGAVAYWNCQKFSAESPTIDVFDTIGAGDAFNAGYLAACQRGRSPQAALEAGCFIASSVIRAFPRAKDQLELPSEETEFS